jgi:hypothetical protein
MTPTELHRKQVLDCCTENNLIMQDVSGLWYFYPDGQGMWSSYDLMVISVELQMRNDEVYRHIQQHLGSPDQPKTFSST